MPVQHLNQRLLIHTDAKMITNGTLRSPTCIMIVHAVTSGGVHNKGRTLQHNFQTCKLSRKC